MIKIFYLTKLEKQKWWLRRYADGPCPHNLSQYNYHNAEVFMGVISETSSPRTSKEDDCWPKACSCGYIFKPTDSYQDFTRTLYKRSDTNEEMTLQEAPFGACWDEYWMTINRSFPNFYIGEDGRCLYVKTPGGDWCLDARASNCTLPDDHTHKCWVRHGKPEDGTLHVDKNGHTCGAGAGSIMMKNYHGFLHHGFLIEC